MPHPRSFVYHFHDDDRTVLDGNPVQADDPTRCARPQEDVGLLTKYRSFDFGGSRCCALHR